MKAKNCSTDEIHLALKYFQDEFCIKMNFFKDDWITRQTKKKFNRFRNEETKDIKNTKCERYFGKKGANRTLNTIYNTPKPEKLKVESMQSSLYVDTLNDCFSAIGHILSVEHDPRKFTSNLPRSIASIVLSLTTVKEITGIIRKFRKKNWSIWNY